VNGPAVGGPSDGISILYRMCQLRQTVQNGVTDPELSPVRGERSKALLGLEELKINVQKHLPSGRVGAAGIDRSRRAGAGERGARWACLGRSAIEGGGKSGGERKRNGE
jgi:hypothetical protein